EQRAIACGVAVSAEIEIASREVVPSPAREHVVDDRGVRGRPSLPGELLLRIEFGTVRPEDLTCDRRWASGLENHPLIDVFGMASLHFIDRCHPYLGGLA